MLLDVVCVCAVVSEAVCCVHASGCSVCVCVCVCGGGWVDEHACVCVHGRNHHILWSDCHWCLNEMKVGAKRKKQDEHADIRLFFQMVSK